MRLFSKFFSNRRRYVDGETVRQEVSDFATQIGRENVVNIETHSADNTQITVWYWAEQEAPGVFS